MKNLKNWDKKTWLSSNKYTSSIINFLEKRVKFNKETKILDIGCGRGKIISTLSEKYQMINLPLGIDIIDHKNAVRKIKFAKANAVKYLSKTKKKFDLILFKQSIHFFTFDEIKKILNLSKKNLNSNGKIIILALHPNQNYWPVFEVFKTKLIHSLKKDKKILDIIKYNFKNYKINYFVFKVKISKVSYLQMIKNRFTSCLLNLSSKELKNGVEEVKKKYKKKLMFNDKLICISYIKK
jgi:ubiquinone/menaquinone biosynthesis C-methylase UbiE|tara:strand:+ start:152 stop:865 length:714 start_codon:yes stop_codon:yes gene_type:complete